MTTPQETPGASEEPEAPVEAAPDPAAEVEQAAAALEPEVDDPDPRVARANREAANYRRQLREAEGERDDVRGRLEKYEREAIEREATGEGLRSSDDLWLATPDLAVLRGDDGNLDAELVTAHITALREARAHWFDPMKGWPSAPQGPRGPLVPPPPESPGAALAQSLQQARRGR